MNMSIQHRTNLHFML